MDDAELMNIIADVDFHLKEAKKALNKIINIELKIKEKVK